MNMYYLTENDIGCWNRHCRSLKHQFESGNDGVNPAY